MLNCARKKIYILQQMGLSRKRAALLKCKQEDHDVPIELTYANRLIYLLLKFHTSRLV